MTNALKKIIAALLLAAVVTSCSKNEEPKQEQTPDIGQTVSETATGEPETTTAAAATTTSVTTTTTASAATTPPVTTTTVTTDPPSATTASAKTTTTAAPVTTAAAKTTTTTAPPVTTTAAPPVTTTAAPVVSPEELEEQVFLLVNQIREEYGLPAYKKLDKLSDAADKRADEISCFYSHTRPDGTACYTVMTEYGLNYSYAGENIAAGQRTAQTVVNDWMNSTMGHREAILSSEYQYMGVGFVRLQGNDAQGYGYYWVQEFYTPL